MSPRRGIVCPAAPAGLDVMVEGEARRLVFAVEPAKVLAFGKGTFTHTRHLRSLSLQ